jgi:glycosyltransferase involved in cell wall biosynthesis
VRVLQVTERYLPAIGGVERHVSSLSKELSKLGIESRVLTTDIFSYSPLTRIGGPHYSSKVIVKRGYMLLPLPQGLGLVSPGMLRELSGVDLVHAHGYGRFPGWLIPYCRARGIPVVATTHASPGRRTLLKTLFDALIPRLSISYAEHVIALTHIEAVYLRSLGVKCDITVIPNGIDLEEFQTRIRSPQKRMQNLILFVGRVDWELKGLDLAIQAVSILVHDHGSDARMLIVGPAVKDSVSRMRRLAERLRVSDRVVFMAPPPREELVRIMKMSSVLILPSRVESFPSVILEGMAVGLPIVASSVGGVPEILDFGRRGLLCKPNDPESLASCILRILSDPELRRRLVSEAEGSLHEFSWSNIAKRVADVYTNVLSTHHIREGAPSSATTVRVG